nr:S9 family peptidase [Pullulanibacillus pueri]
MTNEEVLLYKGKGSVYDPSVSPDGKWLAFCGHEGGEISPDNTGLWVLPLDTPTASPLQLTRHWDRPVGNYVGADASFDDGYEYKWNDDSQALTFITTVGGNCFLKQVNLKGEVSDVLSPENSVITSFDQNKERITFVKATPLSPGDIYLFSEEKTTPLTDHNQKLLESLLLAQPEHFSYTGAEGWEIEGWILLPPHSPKTKASIPVVLQIHGGPHTAYGNAFHHEFQCIAAEGYAVVYTNPRGSQGYGRAFTAACIGDWGKKDQEDILLGLDYALKHYQQLDPERQYVTGGSYGGFMTNTIITCTNRFKAAVTQRCISNMYSFFGTSDIGYFFAKGQLGEADLWKDEDAVLEVSPIRHARNVTTPTCIIHSEEDLRCPIEQAEQWYVALRRLGVDTRFVRFKGENHELSRSGKPKNRLTRLSEIIDWFNRYNSKKNK